ncbi:hypothetical protein SUGI_0478470 [Cryptomeria japonica]|nr:hypothetical protein SUGI_0478470 [Cryptomeria japonica]
MLVLVSRGGSHAHREVNSKECLQRRAKDLDVSFQGEESQAHKGDGLGFELNKSGFFVGLSSSSIKLQSISATIPMENQVGEEGMQKPKICNSTRKVHWQDPLPKHTKSSALAISDGKKTKNSSGNGFLARVFSVCKKVEVSEMNGKNVESFERINIRPVRRPRGERTEHEERIDTRKVYHQSV